jgi:hypothetical protein
LLPFYVSERGLPEAEHISNALHQRTGYPREYILEQIKEKFVREVEAIKSLRGNLE